MQSAAVGKRSRGARSRCGRPDFFGFYAEPYSAMRARLFPNAQDPCIGFHTRTADIRYSLHYFYRHSGLSKASTETKDESYL